MPAKSEDQGAERNVPEKLGIPREEAAGRVIIQALVEALYALRELTEASEYLVVYPEGVSGGEWLDEATQKARSILEQFDFTEPESDD